MCGTSLLRVEAADPQTQSSAARVYHPPDYDFRHGETDLMETKLGRVAGVYYILLLVILTGLSLGILIIAALPLLNSSGGANGGELSQRDALRTNTPISTMMFVTVTPAPPTATFTVAPTPTAPITPSPTPEPCVQIVQAGEGLIDVVSRCGHRDLDVLTPVLSINGIDSSGSIQAGQQIIVPWPTATDDPNLTPSALPEGASAASSVEVAFSASEDPFAEIDVFQPTATATLQPGVQWHIVQPGETMIDLAVIYNANVRVLSELNPEITFSQCDFGEFIGGPACTVQLFQGQYVRVPAPTPTPTIEPSPSGSETATPSPTPTFNAPSLVRPGDLAPFRRDELVTLRWVTTATLGAGEIYRIAIQDETAGVAYTVDTSLTEFTLPLEWQGQSGATHIYQWNVSIVNANGEITLTTESRRFTWEGR